MTHPYLTVLTPTEQRDLASLVKGIDWWDVKELLGVEWDAVKRAMAGQGILYQTAEHLPELLRGEDGLG